MSSSLLQIAKGVAEVSNIITREAIESRETSRLHSTIPRKNPCLNYCKFPSIKQYTTLTLQNLTSLYYTYILTYSSPIHSRELENNSKMTFKS